MGKEMYLREAIEEYLSESGFVDGILSVICQNNGHVPFTVSEGKAEIYCERCEEKIGWVDTETGTWKYYH